MPCGNPGDLRVSFCLWWESPPLGNSFTDCALYFLCEQRLDGFSVAACWGLEIAVVNILGGLWGVAKWELT